MIEVASLGKVKGLCRYTTSFITSKLGPLSGSTRIAGNLSDQSTQWTLGMYVLAARESRWVRGAAIKKVANLIKLINTPN